MANGNHPSILEEIRPGSPAGLPAPWQPVTPRGVAAFAFASLRRLFLVQSVAALILAAVLIRFLLGACLPILRAAIGQIPGPGRLENKVLSVADSTPKLLAESRFLALALDPYQASGIRSTSDFYIEFHQRDCHICSLLGCLVVPYPERLSLELNPHALEAGLDAWKPVALACVTLAVWMACLIVWSVLATLYCLGPWLLALYRDRCLTLGGSWRLSAAALMPGAILVSAGLLGYCLGLLDVIRLTILLVVHLPVGWAYLVLATLRLPWAPDARPDQPNPFGPPTQPPSSDHPFAAPPS